MRGAGKSLWTAVLANEECRQFVAQQLASASLENTVVRVGFGLDDSQRDFPNPEGLQELMKEGAQPVDVWRTVVLRHALEVTGNRPADDQSAAPALAGSWPERVHWFSRDREQAERLLTNANEELQRQGRVLLVLFDAFDRAARDWPTVREWTRGALEVALRLQMTRAIRAKLFIRPDLDEDDEVWRFADSSKLRHNQVNLEWTTADLYGLLFSHLGNHSSFGKEFRDATALAFGESWREERGVQILPQSLKNAEHQQKVIEWLADTYMGRGPKRGYTSSWIPLHLADAKGRLSPRSYLLAFKRAAEHMVEKNPDYHLALNYRSIQEGVVEASRVRVAEIAEDYPWIRPLFEALRGIAVPVSTEDLRQRWSDQAMSEMEEAIGDKLPPRRYHTDSLRRRTREALVDDLEGLGVVYRTHDERINIPDIFRVGFGIRRKGGVRPPR